MGSALSAALRQVAASGLRFAAEHQRGLTASVVVFLGGFGVAAFGIAPLAPDASDLPRRVITEAVSTDGLEGQLDALALQPLTLARSEVTRASDTADSLMRRLGVADASATAWLRTDSTARRLLDGRPGKLVSATLTARGQLQSLVARFPADAVDPSNSAAPTHFSRLTIERTGAASWNSNLVTAPLVATTRLASGTVRSSLFAATDDADIPDAVAMQMAEMFATEIDFHRELRKGDTFSVVYEALTADGEPINWNQGSGRVLAAEFVNDGKAHQAVWFGEGKGGYYDLNGQSKKRSFLASPMAFSRVTSGFALRFHPIFQKWKAHLGVDYGAPTGTPVRSVGDGVVEFAGRQNGYGNVVQIKHSGARMTVYAHLSRIDVRQGQRIDQGQRVGAVGATGWATGPHLHFEFHVNGQHQDPLVIAKASETVTLDAAQRVRFAQVAQHVRNELDVAEALSGRPGRVE
jgi:murein DD-endopeptidase MepM/ murein hydrolase activator NlpD